MASIKDVERVADDLESLIGDLRSELKDSADFARLTQIADEISEHADDAAQTFSSVNESLMSRLAGLGRGRGSGSKSSSDSQSKSRSSS
jgi:hypothetical protein